MKTLTKLVLSCLVLLSVFIFAQIAGGPKKEEETYVYFLDVGQGDSILIEKGTEQILIDGGPDDKVLSELGKVMPVSDRKIETLVLSHPHADHLVGLNQVLKHYEIGQIFANGVTANSNEYLEFLTQIRDKKIPFSTPEIGQLIDLAAGKLTFLWPGPKYEGKEADNLNDTSEVLTFCQSLHCFLFSGDQEKEEQNLMLAYYRGLGNEKVFKSDVLKAPHHGSSNGVNENLLDIIMPKYAIIEVGADNQYGHPHAATLGILGSLGIQIFRTDKDASVRCTINSADLLCGR